MPVSSCELQELPKLACQLPAQQPVLIRRSNGKEGGLSPNVHLAFADCRSCVDIRIEVVDRQNFPIAASPQHDDLAMLAGYVDLVIDADG